MTDKIFICEECSKILTQEEKDNNKEWGHICKAKNYRRPIRCESFLQTYVREEAPKTKDIE